MHKTKNIGGVARIRVNQGLFVAECTIFVDVPVETFNIASSNASSIYVGNEFTVSPTNVYPHNSLNSTIINLDYNKPNKVVKYYSSDESVATVDELTGLVTPIAEGEFTIEARVIKTYNLDENQKTLDDFIQEAIEAGEDTLYAQDDYNDYMDEISIIESRTFTVQSIAVASIEVINSVEDPLYELDLHKTNTFTPDDFGLKLLPQADSSFTWQQLNYKLKDLIITVSNEDVLQIVQTDDPLSYEITVLTFETWQIKQTHITFTYLEEFSVDVHFKLLRNDITSITIEENGQNAIEVILDPTNQQVFDLEANTTINAVDPTKDATYTKLMYKVDLTQAINEIDEYIIDIDPATGHITDNIITPLSRGTTRIKAFVIETDINGDAILDVNENYIVMFEMTEYVTVNVLEQLTSLQVVLKRPKEQTIVVGDELQVVIENFYSTAVYNQIFFVI